MMFCNTLLPSTEDFLLVPSGIRVDDRNMQQWLHNYRTYINPATSVVLFDEIIQLQHYCLQISFLPWPTSWEMYAEFCRILSVF